MHDTVARQFGANYLRMEIKGLATPPLEKITAPL